MTVTGKGETEYVKVSLVSDKYKAFELYLSEIDD